MSEVIEANIAVHSALANVYDNDEPHFRPENKAKVSARLAKLAEENGNQRLLDLGCGTGFIIDLAKPYFQSICGIDITKAMLDKVKTDDHDVKVQIGQVEDLPYEDASFNAATAYSFLDHLEDPSIMLREASRVLKPGGSLYIDLVPNKFYWQSLSSEPFLNDMKTSAFVDREYEMVTANDKKVELQYGIDPVIFKKAEPSKEVGGVDPFHFNELALANGFEHCEIQFDWFLGNAKVLHQQGTNEEQIIYSYLKECLPISKSMFKYVWFVLRKGVE